MIKEMGRMSLAVLCIAFMVGILGLLPSLCYAQQDDAAQKVQTAMSLLKAKAEKLGPAKLEGKSVAADKEVSAIYFGGTEMNNNFVLVDEVQKEAGGTATIFVKSGDQFVRVATNVKKDDGSRAVGTVLDPNGKVIVAIRKNEAFYGEANILGKPYITGYEPIRDAENNVIGIYYVGYPKGQ
jgi:hypothetical protein